MVREVAQGLGWDPRVYISNKIPGNVDAAYSWIVLSSKALLDQTLLPSSFFFTF